MHFSANHTVQTKALQLNRFLTTGQVGEAKTSHACYRGANAEALKS